MGTNIPSQVGSPRPVSQPAQQQVGTPHISVSIDYIHGLMTRLDQASTPEHQRFELRPAGSFDPEAVAQHPDIPVQITTLDLHPSIEETSEPVSAGPIEVGEGVSSLELIAGLSQFNPELQELVDVLIAEQRVLSGSGVA